MNDTTASIFTTMISFGQVMGPVFGLYTTKAIGYRWAHDIVAVICLVFGLIYLLLGDGCQAFSLTY